MTRMPDVPEDDAGIALWIAELRRRCAAGELLEEIPLDEVEGMDEIFDELGAQQWAREDHIAAIAQRRRERRRRRAMAH
jgi:hypothetical protein